LAKHIDIVRVPAKALNVSPDPLQSHGHVLQSIVSRENAVIRAQEAFS
jgi:hypothetical protein